MKRTVGVWVVLIVLFFTFYELFSHRRASGTGAADAEVLSRFGAWAVLGTFLLLFIVFFWWNLRWFRVHNEGVLLLGEGRAAEALEKFKIAHAKTRNALPCLNIGFANLALWRLPEAVSGFEEFFARSKKLIHSSPAIGPMAMGGVALAQALLGKLDLAREPLAALAKGNQATPVSRLAEAVVAARTGDWAGTQRLLATHSASLDQLAGPTRAMAEALEAMAASKLGASGGRVDRARLFREASPENLEQAWPELAEFVERASSGPRPTP